MCILYCAVACIIVLTVGLQNAFKAFGPVKIEWPGRDGKHPRYPPKGMSALSSLCSGTHYPQFSDCSSLLLCYSVKLNLKTSSLT